MKRKFRVLTAMAALAIALAPITARAGSNKTLEGRWDASIDLRATDIPFRLDITGSGDKLQGALFNGDRKQLTTSARLEGDKLYLNFDHYLTRIEATVKDGQLVGEVEARGIANRDTYLSSVPFKAERYKAAKVASVTAPNIHGVWEIPTESAKGEKAWRLIINQNASEASATILRVDGDTGSLTGRYENGRFVLSHFDGSRPAKLEITPKEDGSLHVQFAATVRPGGYTAYREEVARAKGLPEPANYATHTTLRDPNEKFVFRFPDVDGKLVSNTDPKFAGKVIVAVVTGTWCPNCHDEAQYLVPLYKKYRDQGLEVVALDFEEPEQQDDLSRVKAFVKQYGVEYTYLNAGSPAEMWEKVPQAINLNTWPATFFVGRDGQVRRIHAGFAAPASGVFHEQLKEEFTTTIEKLLAEDAPVQSKLGGTTNVAQLR